MSYYNNNYDPHAWKQQNPSNAHPQHQPPHQSQHTHQSHHLHGVGAASGASSTYYLHQHEHQNHTYAEYPVYDNAATYTADNTNATNTAASSNDHDETATTNHPITTTNDNNSAIDNNNNSTANQENDNTIIEADGQEQVVPASLDHLSRDELCQMVFRLDYERSALKQQVEVLKRNAAAAAAQENHNNNNNNNNNNYNNHNKNNVDAEDVGENNVDNGGGKKGNKRGRTSYDSNSKQSSTGNSLLHSSQSNDQSAHHTLSISASATNTTTHATTHNNNATTNNSIIIPQNSPAYQPTPQEIAKVQKRLSKNIIHAIKTFAIHGGRKIPKTTCTEGNVPPSIVYAIMSDYSNNNNNNSNNSSSNGNGNGNINTQSNSSTKGNHQNYLISDTKRMSKWNITNNDRAISSILQCERLIHPVKHDGTGYIIPSGSSSSSIYNWAKFVGMEVRYDKRDLTLQVTVKTSAAGSGRPEFVPEKVKYSKGEREDFPGVESLFG